MAQLCEKLYQFYQLHLPEATLDNTTLISSCPFCSTHGQKNIGKIIVYLNKEGFFEGFFRCSNRCVPGGFPKWFGQLAGVAPTDIPGFDPDREPYLPNVDYPPTQINDELIQYMDRLSPEILERFNKAGIHRSLLTSLKIGFNGRYIVYPYVKEDGNCYSARCIFPDKQDDFFWHGDENFFDQKSPLFNVEEIKHCEDGALFICEGEENLLTLKQLGFPGVAVHNLNGFELLDPEQFDHIKTIFIATVNRPESEAAARQLASRIGFKVRLFPWPTGTPKNYSLWQLAKDKGNDFASAVIKMLNDSRAFSPFSSPEKENSQFFERLSLEGGEQFRSMRSGFEKLDNHLEGIHGINVIGGAPKAGKSAYMIQVATSMSMRKVPVLYYDFENGRQKIYQRTLSRLSRLTANQLRDQRFDDEEQQRYEQAVQEFRKMLYYFRVINNRKVSPEIMRRHIDFIRHETRSEFTVVVIDSLHKLPFKDFSERRTGIDAWLRQMESIRDELKVSFLVISELSRGEGDAYQGEPHMGMFKGSGDIEYSADNAMIFKPAGKLTDSPEERNNGLWLVASREHGPGKIADYQVDYPYWGFKEV